MNHRPLTRAALLGLAALLLPLAASGCSSETKDNAKDTLESAKDDAGQAADDIGARTTAEALRASLKNNDKVDADGIRSVAAIEESAADLPGDPDVSGIDDGDGDGLDDDGKVQVTAGDGQACLVLPETGTDTTVEDGAC